jgi:hypothetical protein
MLDEMGRHDHLALVEVMKHSLLDHPTLLHAADTLPAPTEEVLDGWSLIVTAVNSHESRGCTKSLRVGLGNWLFRRHFILLQKKIISTHES